MSKQPTSKKKFRRWRYIIDWRQQMGFTVEIVAVLCGVCVIYSVGVHYLLGNETLFQVSIDRFREVVLRVNAVYLAVSSGIFSLMAIGLTHRFVGPAFNMRRVLKAMIKGDFSREVHLRKRDYLKDLATENPNVRRALIGVFSDWITRTNIDGYRIDTVKHVEHDFWAEFCPAIRRARRA